MVVLSIFHIEKKAYCLTRSTRIKRKDVGGIDIQGMSILHSAVIYTMALKLVQIQKQLSYCNGEWCSGISHE